MKFDRDKIDDTINHALYVASPAFGNICSHAPGPLVTLGYALYAMPEILTDQITQMITTGTVLGVATATAAAVGTLAGRLLRIRELVDGYEEIQDGFDGFAIRLTPLDVLPLYGAWALKTAAAVTAGLVVFHYAEKAGVNYGLEHSANAVIASVPAVPSQMAVPVKSPALKAG